MCNHHGIELMRHKYDRDKEAACARSSCIYYHFAKPRAVLLGIRRGGD
jgi:hypothetical protein